MKLCKKPDVPRKSAPGGGRHIGVYTNVSTGLSKKFIFLIFIGSPWE